MFNYLDTRKNKARSTFHTLKPGWLFAHALMLGGVFYLGHLFWPNREEDEE